MFPIDVFYVLARHGTSGHSLTRPCVAPATRWTQSFTVTGNEGHV